MVVSFDPRIVPPRAVELARALQSRVPGILGGGAALAGVYLHHRLSRDLDLFFAQRDDVRTAMAALPDVATSLGIEARIVRDAGTFVRATLTLDGEPLEVDLVHEPTPPVAPAVRSKEGITIASLEDLRASKVTCILSRAEPRDLVDLLFLDRAGHPPEDDVSAALTKDAGVDPATLAWLLRDFPVEPLPKMLEPLSADQLRAFRDELAKRFARLAVPR
jgi:hypothetical protein